MLLRESPTLEDELPTTHGGSGIDLALPKRSLYRFGCMPTSMLARLTPVDLRSVWRGEATDFTPWLAQPENLALLGETLGLGLELRSQEQAIGDFRADIVCTNAQDDSLVLIENQLEQTDHTHLGQLLTYAAGLEAVTIIWVVQTFREEHRAALDWLNEMTPEQINFFGIEMRLFRIGDSPVAPQFTVICKPNQWTRTVAESAREPSEQSAFRWMYWSEFVKQPLLGSILSAPLQPNRQGNLPIPTNWQQFKLQVAITVDGAAIYLSCRGPRRFENLSKLEEQRDVIEACAGTRLSWRRSESNNQAWVVLNLPGIESTAKADWPRQHALLAAKTVEFYRCLDKIVQPLDGALQETV